MNASTQGIGRAAANGLLAALVGFASSFTIVVQGLSQVGATPSEAASGLFMMCVLMCLASGLLSLTSRLPISIVWSTPGSALLIACGVPAGGFAAAGGAFVLAGLMIAVTGFFRPLERLVTSIPKPIASAMLAGILLHLCLAPFIAVAEFPKLALPVILTWALVGRFARLLAVPAAVLVAVVLISLSAPETIAQLHLTPPPFDFAWPVFTHQAAIGIAVPLFIVTMASQNIPGLAVLNAVGYRPRLAPIFATTGLFSIVGALFGGATLNLAAITAVLTAGPDAHPDPARRYWAAAISGVGYLVLGLLAVPAIAFIHLSPPIMIQAVAGLALIGALGNALGGMLAEKDYTDAGVVTFLITASSLSFYGIGSAFWGLLGGLAYHMIRRPRPA